MKQVHLQLNRGPAISFVVNTHDELLLLLAILFRSFGNELVSIYPLEPGKVAEVQQSNKDLFR